MNSLSGVVTILTELLIGPPSWHLACDCKLCKIGNRICQARLQVIQNPARAGIAESLTRLIVRRTEEIFRRLSGVGDQLGWMRKVIMTNHPTTWENPRGATVIDRVCLALSSRSR